MIYFRMYRSKIHITQHFMLIAKQKNFFILTIIFKSNGNDNGNVYLYLAFLAQNGEGTVRKILVTMREQPETERERELEQYKNEIITVNF